jgi:transcriptional regulator
METMYLTPAFQQTDGKTLHALIRANPLGMLVTVADGVPDANHLPFLLSDDGHHGTLRGHVARANSVWKGADNTPALVVFRGSDGYISPAWYQTKSETGKVVPTWNYTVIHARGTLRVVEDVAWLRDHVTRLVAEHESNRDHPWSVADAPADYIEALLGGIIGIEMPIAELVGKWKLSQNRSAADREGVLRGLTAERPEAMALAESMRLSTPT